jgi:ankyrin repeat protein
LGSEALLRAAHEDDVAAVTRLLREGADVRYTNDLGATALWAACENGSLPMASLLLRAGASPDAALLQGETPLMTAARGGHAEVVGVLLEHKARVNARGPREQTALMWAAARKHATVVKQLIDAGADIHARTAEWTDMMAVPPHGYRPYNKTIPHGRDTALLFAAREGDLESMQLLVAAGANVNDADAWGVSALALAAHSGFTEMVSYLLSKGANPNACEAGFCPLHCAILRRDAGMAAALLAKGADANAPLRTWTPTRRSSKDYHFAPELVGARPYWLAARHASPEIMNLLTQYKADARAVHHSIKVTDATGAANEDRTDAIVAAMAKSSAWVEFQRDEALVLACVKAAMEAGVKPSARAVSAAKALRYEKVAALLGGE